MQITIAAVGRDRSATTRTLFETYRTRCPWPIALVEIPLSTAREASARRHAETLRLAKAVAGHARLISLDPAGHLLDSQRFADQLRDWRDEGSTLGVAIGGPDGFDAEALPRVDLALAFGRMTWPHQLIRVMLAEQLYRASTILAGHPYHRG